MNRQFFMRTRFIPQRGAGLHLRWMAIMSGSQTLLGNGNPKSSDFIGVAGNVLSGHRAVDRLVVQAMIFIPFGQSFEWLV